MNVYGLFVGLNYAGTDFELGGCLSDAGDYYEKFSPHCNDSAKLVEADATKQKILGHLGVLVGALKYRDQLIFTYSGHGTWVPDKSGDEPDGKDEALCPWDCQENLILDDELQAIFKKRVKGSKIIFITDSCHSGTVFKMFGERRTESRIKFIPPQQLLSGKKELDAIKKAERVLSACVVKIDNKPVSGIIHFGGCQDTEYSYDAEFDGKPNGAFTYNFMKAMKTVVEDVSSTPTWKQLYTEIMERLPTYDHPQRPKFNATTADGKTVVIGY